jgi:hypothetical protein
MCEDAMYQRGAWSVRRCCRRLLPWGACAGLVAGAVLLGLTGCQSLTPRAQSPEEEAPARYDLLKQVRTVGDVTEVANVAPIQISGVGLVTGLDGTGGGTPPGTYTTMLEQQLLKQRQHGVKELLQSPNNAVVLITALIPPGGRKGDPIDIQVTLPQGSKVTSLRGGYLQQTVLRNYDSKKHINPQYQGNDTLLPGHILAVARGPVLVGMGEGDAAAKLRRGVIWEGGVSLIDRPFYLVLKNDQKFAAVANAVAERINLMFPDDARKREEVLRNKRLLMLDEVTSQINEKFRPVLAQKSETARAVNREVVYAQVPHTYRLNPERYLRIARLIPLRESPESQGKYHRLLEEMLTQSKHTVGAALRLEALGRDSVPVLEKALKNPNVLVRFSAAEALAYLGSTAGVEELARLSDQYDALRAYGLTAMATVNESICKIKLEELLDSPCPDMRYGAFKALRILDDHEARSATVKGELLNDAFWLHRVAVQSEPLVHATFAGRPEVVLFGKEPRLAAPLKLFAGAEFTITAERNDDRCTVSRYVLNPPSLRRKQCSFRVEDVLRTVAELGGQYADAVELLRQVDRTRSMSARLAVDALPQAPAVEELAQEGVRMQKNDANDPPSLLLTLPELDTPRPDTGATPPMFALPGTRRSFAVGELQDEEALLRRGVEPAGN